MFGFRYIPNIVTLGLDTAKCNGCGKCLIVCPHEVFLLENRKAVIADRDACMECGACSMNCETEALTVDAGVGCATGIIIGAIRGTEPDCGCGDGGVCC